MARVLAIGLDGATWTVLRPAIERGELPTLGRFVRDGASGVLQSCIPPVSAPAWVTFSTGKNPGKHGVFAFQRNLRDISSGLVNATTVDGERLWHILDRAGKRSCLINLPVTYPLKPMNGIMVSSFLTPVGAKDFATPREITHELTELGYRIDLELEEYGMVPDSPDIMQKRDGLLAELEDIAEKRHRAAAKLLAREPWDLFLVMFKETDLLQHLFFDASDRLVAYYRRLDQYIESLWEQFVAQSSEPALALVVSDHGFHPAQVWQFAAYPWLRGQPLIAGAQPRKPLWRRIANAVNEVTRRVGFDMKRTKAAARNYMKYTQHVRESLPFYACTVGIFIDADKLPPGAGYDEVRERLIEGLRSLRTEDGTSVFKEVGPRERYYHGPHLSEAPDIVFMPDPKIMVSSDWSMEQVLSPREVNMPGQHWSAFEGVVMAFGPEVAPGVTLDGANLMDCLPTILHAMGIPVPDDIDGRVWMEMFRPESESARRPLQMQPAVGHRIEGAALDAQGEAVLKDRLAALGYLE